MQSFNLVTKYSTEQTYGSNRIITFNFVENATKNSKSFCQWFLGLSWRSESLEDLTLTQKLSHQQLIKLEH